MAIHEYDGLGGGLESIEWLTRDFELLSGKRRTNLEDLVGRGQLAWVSWTRHSPTKWVKHLQDLKKAEALQRRVWNKRCSEFETFIAKVEALKKLKEEIKIDVAV
jgi:hypothetical protein